MGPIPSAALKVALSAGAVALVLVRTRKFPRGELGLVRPAIAPALLFGLLYLGWMLGTDAVLHWRGPWDWRPWIEAPLIASAMRVLAVCVLGPTAEELIFRGWFFAVLRSRIGVMATIGVTALGWSLLHYDYPPIVIFVIFVDGLFLGLARWKSGSLFPPIAMHMLYNLYAVW